MRTFYAVQGAVRESVPYACGDGTDPAAQTEASAGHDEAPAIARERGQPGASFKKRAKFAAVLPLYYGAIKVGKEELMEIVGVVLAFAVLAWILRS